MIRKKRKFNCINQSKIDFNFYKNSHQQKHKNILEKFFLNNEAQKQNNSAESYDILNNWSFIRSRN